jgi:glutamyl-tRNA reductase
VSLGDVPEQLTQCDIVLTSTESPIPLVSLESVREAMSRRADRNLFIIDLSVPRDVEEGVDRIAGVHLYELDDLEQVVSRNSQARRGEVSKAEELVAAYAADYQAWLRSQELSPTIHGLKQQLGAITSKKLNAMKKDLDEKEMRHAEDLAHQLERSFLALIVRNLKQLAENGEKPDCLDTVNRLFGIEIDRPKPQVRDEP